MGEIDVLVLASGLSCDVMSDLASDTFSTSTSDFGTGDGGLVDTEQTWIGNWWECLAAKFDVYL